MQRKTWAAMVLCLSVSTTAWADPVAGPVGPLGDPARLDFSGNLPASAERLRFLLAGDVELSLAAAPDKPLADYLTALDRRLRVALSSAGWPRPEVTVDATAKPGRVAVSIDPGTRRHQGSTHVTGDTDRLDTSTLRHRLATATAPGPFPWTHDGGTWTLGPTRKTDDPAAVWGDPTAWASFDTFHENTLAGSVAGALAEMGYLDARVTTEVTDDGTAGVLGVRVRSLGPPAVIAGVKVTGVERNTASAVADLAGLRTGQRLDLRALEGAQQRLWDGARFDRHTIAISRSPGTDAGQYDVAIDVLEGKGPPLGQPFSPVEQVLLRTRDWVTALANSDRDIRFDGTVGAAPAPHGEFSLAMGGRSGFSGLGRYRAGTDRPVDVWAGLALTPATAGFYLPAEHLEFAASAATLQLQPSFRVDPNDDAPSDGTHRWTLALNCQVAGIGATEPPDGPPVKLDLSIAPAYMVDRAHSDSYAFDLRDGVLTITPAASTTTAPTSGPTSAPTAMRLRIAADTGAFLDLDGGASTGNLAVQVGPGLVAGEVAAITRAVGVQAANGYEPDRFLGSWMVFLDAEVARLAMVAHGVPAARADRSVAVLRKVLGPAAFAPLALPAGSIVDPSALSMPPSLDLPNANPAFVALAGYMLPINDHLFARDTWPWRVGRAGGYLVANQGGAADELLQPISADGGPLACLATAELLQLRSRDAARAVARQGLDRLAAEPFDQDVHGLLADGSAPAEVARRVVDNLRRLAPNEVDDLTAGLPPAAQPRVRMAIGALRLLSAMPGDKAVELLLSRAWDQGVKDSVAAALRRLAGA